MLFEDIYMAQCQGFVDDPHPNFVCKLHKSFYGLKQAPHAWFECFTNQLLTLGFIASNAVPSMFIFHQQSCTLFLLVFMDDIIIIGINLLTISDMITQLYSTFEPSLDYKLITPLLVSFFISTNTLLISCISSTCGIASPTLLHAILILDLTRMKGHLYLKLKLLVLAALWVLFITSHLHVQILP